MHVNLTDFLNNSTNFAAFNSCLESFRNFISIDALFRIHDVLNQLII